MLEFWKDGVRYHVPHIDDKGKIGQTVILDLVGFDKNSKDPLAKYTQPYAFTIMAIERENHVVYTLRDQDGIEITANGYWIFEAKGWLHWKNAHEVELRRRGKRDNEKLQGHLDLLKAILTNQGIKIVTEEQAKNLKLI